MRRRFGLIIGCRSCEDILANLADLKDRHLGETIWVLGSGPSLNFIDGTFFDNKITVSTNFSARAVGHHPDYTFTHYHGNVRDLLSDSRIVVTIENDTETFRLWDGEKPDGLVLAPTQYEKPPGSSWNPMTSHKPGLDQIAYGSSSLHGAMHLAAHLGAYFIVLVGADCGNIDGASRVNNYARPHGHTLWQLYNEHHKLMKDYLEDNYPVKVHSLNPFINLNLEGHRFEGV
jgi:hypothetical protein